MVKKIKNLLKTLYHLDMFIISRVDGKMFSLCFNMMNRTRSVRVKYLKKEKLFHIKDMEYKLYCHHRTLALDYKYGIKERIDKLSKAYYLEDINFKNGDVVVDCGANKGDLYLYFRDHKIDINYFGIEPSPLEYKCLSKNISNQNLYNIGLWHKESSLKFYVNSEEADSSLIEPKRYTHTIDVKTRRLDSMDINKPIKLLKLEAEGAEPEVIKGCSNILDQIEYISADLGPERGIKEECTLEMVTNYLLSKNFEVLKISHDRVVALYKNKDYNVA